MRKYTHRAMSHTEDEDVIAEDERRLARRAAEGDLDARDRLVEANVRLVVAIARSQRGRGVPYADLV